jgi:hypothetical protein
LADVATFTHRPVDVCTNKDSETAVAEHDVIEYERHALSTASPRARSGTVTVVAESVG